ncbi:DUF262 domain-containing protein [Paraburkholderia metrosideri]|uniref:DUF262 domain-containing protein n=1 Tax=Paraburkholderia metrosideri TaxID=580937 RepID=UPI001F2E12A1|nr:DUF262 domain-containing protein [Paraburkholderia metrosideri]
MEPITIKEAVEKVHRKNYLLPAIQREFVWNTYQIEKLFDSLMRDYPISSFLFWDVERENVGNYQFYEFVQNYHERDGRHNPKSNTNGEHGITAILDGQQRLTSLYIGLKGTYAYKLPHKRWDNNTAFPKRRLHLNLIAPSADDDFEYDFSFLTADEAMKSDAAHYWFSVGEVLNFKEIVDVNSYLITKGISSIGPEQFLFANRALFKLYDIVHNRRLINFFLERDESLDKVLNIFIRVNSGGTQLNYSDLLLSIATAQWKELDAREEITSFVDEINAIGDGFNVNKDFVLKSCLVLSDFSEIAFKVDNFNQANMLRIEKNWPDICGAIRAAFDLLSVLGYQRDTLTSNNAVIPIAYYLKKIGSPLNFSDSGKYVEDRKKIFKWLVAVLLKGTFSGQPDNVLRPIREVISKSGEAEGFPVEQIAAKLRGTSKSLNFDDDEITSLLHFQYAQPYTYSILAFLYPTLDFRNKFHQDHIFPKSLFTAKRLAARNIPEANIARYLDSFNRLANLQLLEGVPNMEKSGKDFGSWLIGSYPNVDERKAYMARNYIPEVDLSLENFAVFIEEREKLIVAAFKSLLK